MNDSLHHQSPAVIYLHGLASSPQSAKAVFFKKKFEHLGWTFVAPDLNLPDFKSTTLSRGIADVARELSTFKAQQPVILMGSSFGGLTALHAYNQLRNDSQILGLILLAPAFEFLKNKEMSAGDVEKWRTVRDLVICHNNLPLNFGIIEDLSRYDSYAVSVDVPCLVIHGRRDATIGVEQSERFREVNPQVALDIFEDDHQLSQSFPKMWDESPVNGAPIGRIPEFITSKICPL